MTLSSVKLFNTDFEMCDHIIDECVQLRADEEGEHYVRVGTTTIYYVIQKGTKGNLLKASHVTI